MTLKIGEFECSVLNFNLGFNTLENNQSENLPRERLVFLTNSIDYTKINETVLNIVQAYESNNNQLDVITEKQTYSFQNYIFEGINAVGADKGLIINITFTKEIDLSMVGD